MGARIAIIGAGAVGSYAGAHMARAGEDVTFVDPWPENVEAIRTRGLTVSHLRDVPEFTVPARAIHITELQHLSKEAPVDIAFICMKSYDTAWAAMMIRQYLAPGAFMVSLQNCINEETIAGIVGWGRILGTVANTITVELLGPGHVRRAGGKASDGHIVFRVGEVHGRVTDRATEVCRLVGFADTAKVTNNLWGERWSKLTQNAMFNGVSACTGLVNRDIILDDTLRRFTLRLGSEAVRVGQALGYQLEIIHHATPDVLARGGEGDAEAAAEYDALMLAEAGAPGGGAHRPSMGQDMVKGRRTEIDFLNGFVVGKGQEIGIHTPANAALADIVRRVERGDLKPDRKHILDLRLN
jgi:2-dehydropantoate 2-reductase